MFTPRSLDPLPWSQWLPRVILISLTAGCILPVAELIAVTDWFKVLGSGICFFLHRSTQLILLPTAAFILLIPAWLILLRIKPHQDKAILRLVYGSLFIVSIFVGYGFSHEIRQSAFQHLAARSQFLIDAIKEYEAKFGYPPFSARSLVPYVLDKVPETGMAAYPEYQVVGSRDEKGQTYWMVYISCPNEGLIDFDEFVYLPDGNYYGFANGNSVELMNGWAYIDD